MFNPKWQENFRKKFAKELLEAKQLQGSDAILKAHNIDGDVRIQYNDQRDFERIARQFGIFEEWKVIMKLTLPLCTSNLILFFLLILRFSLVFMNKWRTVRSQNKYQFGTVSLRVGVYTVKNEFYLCIHHLTGWYTKDSI
jgi:GNT-I family